jgi:hypothetical protein
MSGFTSVIRTNRDRYRENGQELGYIQPVRSRGKYHTPLIETIDLSTGLELDHALRANVGKIRIISRDRKSFNVAWADGEAGTNFERIPSAGVYEDADIAGDKAPTTIYLQSDFDNKLVIITWLIG